MENREPNSIKWRRWYRLKKSITQGQISYEGITEKHCHDTLRHSVFMVEPHPTMNDCVCVVKSIPTQPKWRLPEFFIEPLTPGNGPNQQKTQTNP